jgi:hypothetical protein
MWQRHKESHERRAAAWSSERRDEPTTPLNAQWRLNETLAYLLHLEATGRAERLPGEVEHWRSTLP